ncbi:arabinan endo-1,5-alpha-L-arabinosidase [Caulobacter sp. BK020]|uniref:arabinan endo-1,5-alpha-L-arabinosidase n=1 Tax=Caulobacter sp. BK020 TaxID=2512117 RepID=UPI00104F8E64|nr:arabinan endo-1,5-alpha-L-arabinosidase [Caulobacter sp. BK020]TCS14408.1 arabinan endo-1,5-alpha-L-arabinosidase [Caulobacter sp. BK020]
MLTRRYALAGGLSTASLVAAPALAEASLNDRMTGDLSPVHDPCIIRQGGTYHLFCTSQANQKPGLIPWRTSPDLVRWTLIGAVMPALPDWAQGEVPGVRGAWAPDISLINGRYHLYYALSTFGKNRSAIALQTTATLDRSDPAFGWRDEGVVLASRPSDDFNAIDPNIVTTSDGRVWMSFGSFWSGLKLVEIDPTTGKPRPGAPLAAIAARPRPSAVEAPCIVERDGWFYLFASFDFCCRGADSTYYTVVGRSKAVAGPYVDRDGKAMMKGGGFIVLHADLDPTRRFKGPGHVAVLRDDGRDHIVYHAYDARKGGVPTLRIQPLGWTADGWPVAL